MTTHEPHLHPGDITSLPEMVYDIVQHSQQALTTIEVGILRDYDPDTMRGIVAVKDEPSVKGELPIQASLAGNGYGDIPALSPGDTEGLICYSLDAGRLTDTLSSRGATTPHNDTQARQHDTLSQMDGVFIPGAVYTNDDTIPDHTPGERLISHPNGTVIRMTPDSHGEPDFRIEHPSGATLELDGEDIPDEDPDPREVPNSHEGFARLEHSSGAGVLVHDDGIALERGTGGNGYGEGGYNEGGYGEGDVNHAPPTVGVVSDPWRVELTGEFGHVHRVQNPDGTYSVTGPPVSHREMFEYYLSDEANITNLDAPVVQATQSYLYDYLGWLESEMATTLDPGDTEHHGWPSPEPVPDASERRSFEPAGFGEEGFGDAGFGT